jgi:hypothetical protein
VEEFSRFPRPPAASPTRRKKNCCPGFSCLIRRQGTLGACAPTRWFLPAHWASRSVAVRDVRREPQRSDSAKLAIGNSARTPLIYTEGKKRKNLTNKISLVWISTLRIVLGSHLGRSVWSVLLLTVEENRCKSYNTASIGSGGPERYLPLEQASQLEALTGFPWGMLGGRDWGNPRRNVFCQVPERFGPRTACDCALSICCSFATRMKPSLTLSPPYFQLFPRVVKSLAKSNLGRMG